MKKRGIMGVFLCVALSMAPTITANANSLSYIPPQEVTGIPQDIYETANIIGAELNICPELLLAIAERESTFRPDAVNGSCKGLMQVSVNLHKDRFEKMGWSSTEWSNGYKNMYVAADYLAELFEEYEDVGIVLGVYHGESEAVARGMKGQLSPYVNEILTRSEELERINNK